MSKCLNGYDWCQTCDGDFHGRIWQLSSDGLTLKAVANITASDGHAESGWFPITRDEGGEESDGAFLIDTTNPARDLAAILYLYALAVTQVTEWQQNAREALRLAHPKAGKEITE